MNTLNKMAAPSESKRELLRFLPLLPSQTQLLQSDTRPSVLRCISHADAVITLRISANGEADMVGVDACQSRCTIQWVMMHAD